MQKLWIFCSPCKVNVHVTHDDWGKSTLLKRYAQNMATYVMILFLGPKLLLYHSSFSLSQVKKQWHSQFHSPLTPWAGNFAQTYWYRNGTSRWFSEIMFGSIVHQLVLQWDSWNDSLNRRKVFNFIWEVWYLKYWCFCPWVFWLPWKTKLFFWSVITAKISMFSPMLWGNIAQN